MLCFKKVSLNLLAIFTIFFACIQTIKAQKIAAVPIADWAQPNQVMLDSKILTINEFDLIFKMINEVYPISEEFNLMYRASRDGFDAETFHSILDSVANTVVIIKSQLTNNVFGGVNNLAWSSENDWSTDNGTINWSSDNNTNMTTFNNVFLYSLRRAGKSKANVFWQNLQNHQSDPFDIHGNSNTGPFFGQADLILDTFGNAYMMGCNTFECPIGYESTNTAVYYTGLNKCNPVIGDDFGLEAITGKQSTCSIVTITNEPNQNLYIFPVSDYEVHQFVLQPQIGPFLPYLETVILNMNEIGLIFSMTGAQSLQLLHRGSRDGFNPISFHQNCDNQPNTIIIVKSMNSDYVFGGYVSVPWDMTSGFKMDKTAYQFSLRRNGRSKIYKSHLKPKRNAIKCSLNAFISFNGGLKFSQSFDPLNPNPTVIMTACNGVWSCPPGCKSPGLAKKFFTGSNNNSVFAADFEVFKIHN